MKSVSLILALMFTAVSAISFTGTWKSKRDAQTASGIISSIIEKTGSPVIPNTVDVIKEGSPDTPVRGIVTTMFATMDVLREAVAKDCNLIIAHEPLYYNHLDETGFLQNDQVFLEKQRFIREHKLVIWRFHDYIHSMKPDGIETGMLEKLGWKKYSVGGSQVRFRLPETTLEDLIASLKKIFPNFTFYVVGKPDMKLTNVTLAPGAPGSRYHIELLERDDVDVLLAGESPQWETYEYARDAVSQGRKKSVIFLGHIASEEYGMKFCADWLKGFITGIPVYYIECGPSYKAY